MSQESTVQIQVPAELQKISEVIINGVKSFKAGQSWQQIGVAALPAVLAEMGSFEEIKEEFSSDKLVPFIGLALGGVAGVFLAKQAASFMAKRAEKMQLKKPIVHPELKEAVHPEAHEVAAQ